MTMNTPGASSPKATCLAMPSNTANLALTSLLASGVVWGLAWWPLKFFASEGLTGHLIGLTAYALVGVVTLPLVWRERRDWQDERWLLLLIGLFFGCANMAFTSALMSGSVVRAMLLFYLLPAWGAIGGKLFLNERLQPRRLLAVGLSLGGVFVVMGSTDVLRQPLSFSDAMALAAGFCYTAAGITNRKARLIPMTSRTLVSFVGCGIVALFASAASIPQMPEISPSTWLLLVLFAFVWLLGGTLLTTYGVTHVEASRAAVLQVVELIVAVASAILLGGESLGLKEYVGGTMIVIATLLESSNTNHGG